MKIKDKLIDAFLGRVIESKVKDRIKAASILDSPNIEDLKWRRLTGNANRELLPTTQDRMIEIAYWLYQTNALAGWLIDITTAFIMAEELPYESKDEDVKGVLDGFWNDPINRMDLYLPKHVSELHIFGELCMPAFVAEQTGRVRLGYVDPAQIGVVVTDPENVKMQIGILTKGWIGEVAGYQINQEPKKYSIVLPEEADYVLSPTAKKMRAQFTDGDCFYFSINNVTNSPRGRSSLLSVCDWLDAYEQYLFDFADKWPLQNAFVWDLVVQGGTIEEITKQVNNFSKKSGSVFGHNEKVTLEAVAPEMKAIDAQTGARMFRNHILGRFGYPEHWYGGGGDVNRATASEMDVPAIKMLSYKQNYIKFALEEILGYQVRQARRARFIPQGEPRKTSGLLRGEDRGFTVTTPVMQSKDVSKFGSMVQQVATALQQAEMQQWVDKETAQKLFAAIVGFLGVDIDLEEVKKNIADETFISQNQDYLKKGQKPPVQVAAVKRVK